MTPKDYLMRLTRLQYNIYIADEEVERLRARVTSTTVPLRDDSGGGGGGAKDGTAALIAKIADLDSSNAWRREKYEAERAKIVEQIQGMERSNDIMILYQRYVQGMPLIQIAEKNNYSYDHIKHMHGFALQRFGEKYGPFE